MSIYFSDVGSRYAHTLGHFTCGSNDVAEDGIALEEEEEYSKEFHHNLLRVNILQFAQPERS